MPLKEKRTESHIYFILYPFKSNFYQFKEEET
jgi:hypothetical protein